MRIPKYNIIFIDTREASEVMRIFTDYYENGGWEFVGWLDNLKPVSDKDTYIRQGIFKRIIDN